MRILIGDAARALRESLGLSQREAAIELDISYVHLCNIENNKATPSTKLLETFHDLWGIDLYVYAWCKFGTVNNMPSGLRGVAKDLGDAWETEIEAAVERHKKGTSASQC